MSSGAIRSGSDLVCFVDTVATARRTRRIIWHNFVGTIAVDTIGIVLPRFFTLSKTRARAGRTDHSAFDACLNQAEVIVRSDAHYR